MNPLTDLERAFQWALATFAQEQDLETSRCAEPSQPASLYLMTPPQAANPTGAARAAKVHYQPLASQATSGSLNDLEQVAALAPFSQGWVCSRPQWLEFQIHLAWALVHCRDGVICCAAKEHGADRLSRWPELAPLIEESQSKAHCRILRLRSPGSIDRSDLVPYWESLAKRGALQQHPQTQIWTAPGVYGWEKIDIGSKLLVEYLPAEISGRWADFGCGTGYLLRALSSRRTPAIGPRRLRVTSELHGLENDARAVQAAHKNLDHIQHLHLHWCDITAGLPPEVPPLDGIVSNPPFHEQTRSAISLAVRFLEVAAHSLTSTGPLYVVGQASLPYESILRDLFGEQQLLARDKGFKVLKAMGPKLRGKKRGKS